MNRKIKILHLISEISDGGAETQLKTNLLNIDKSRFSSSILMEYAIAKSANFRILQEHNVPMYSAFAIPTSFMGKVINKLQRMLIPASKRDCFIQWYVKWHILLLKPNVIHVHLQTLKYLVPIADKLKGIKLYYRCASKPDRYFDTKDELYRKEYEAAKYLIAHNDLQMIALHKEMQESLNRIFGINNTIVIHNAFDIQKFANAQISKEQIREQICIPQDAFVIGHVGRFYYIKNQDFLVDVFCEVAKVKMNAYLLMIGRGNTEEIEQKLCDYGLSDRYKILADRDDVHLLLHAMDVFVFPSLLEGMPGALIEAQASGLKCIASSSITSEAIVTSKAIQMDLDAGAQAWADKIINDEFDGKPETDIMSFDVKNVMHTVEQLYLS